MRAIYVGRYFSTSDHRVAISSVSLPILERKEIKREFRGITKEVLSFSDIDYENVKIYYSWCKMFMKNSSLTSTTIHIAKYHRSDFCRAVFDIVLSEYSKHKNEEVRVYIPFDNDKTFLHTLEAMTKKQGLNIEFEEIHFAESVFQQIASLIAGCVYYRRDDENYLNNLGMTAQAQLTAYVYSAKKPEHKLDIIDYIPKIKNQAR